MWVIERSFPRLLTSRSRDSWKLSLRCGFRPKALQMRRMVDWLRPVLAASMRLDQCVTPFGVFSSVSRTTCATLSSPISRGAPGRGSSPRLAIPSAMNRFLQKPTVKPVVCSFLATAALLRSPAQLRMIRARKPTARLLRICEARRDSLLRCSSLTISSCFLVVLDEVPCHHHRPSPHYM